MKDKNKKSFIIHNFHYEPIKHLSDEDLGKLFRGIFEYQISKGDSNYPKEPTGFLGFSGELKMAFSFFKNQLDLDNLNYQEKIVERNRANGMKGGRPSKPKEPKKPSGLKITQKSLNDNDIYISSSLHSEDILKNKPKGLSKKSTKTKNQKFIPPTIQEIQDYCLERKNGIDAKKFFDYYHAGNWIDGDGKAVQNWKQKIITWENKSKQEPSPSVDNTDLVDGINNIANEKLISKIETSGNKAILYLFGSEHHQKLFSLPENLRNQIKQQIALSLQTTALEFKF